MIAKRTMIAVGSFAAALVPLSLLAPAWALLPIAIAAGALWGFVFWVLLNMQ